jgi:tRNA (guanine-N7-)-methyltransferase
MVEKNHLPLDFRTENLYGHVSSDSIAAPTAATIAAKAASIQTYYEQMWIDRGLDIRYMLFHLPHEGELVEPDIEIPLDDYRSYRRDKRSPLETAK